MSDTSNAVAAESAAAVAGTAQPDSASSESKPSALHSPPATDSNNTHKSDASDSELSDLEDSPVQHPKPALIDTALPEPPQVEPLTPEASDDDIGEIKPEFVTNGVPVFRPTMKQFRDFKRFMGKVDSYGMKSGIIKIIPPAEWKDSLPPVDDLVKKVRIREPIKQEIMGNNGTYRQIAILHQRSYNVPNWRQLCDQTEHQPPARRGERRAQAEKPKPATRSRPAGDSAASTPAKKPAAPKRRGRPGKGRRGAPRGGKSAATVERPITPESPTPANDDKDVDGEAVVEDEVPAESVEDPGVKIEDEEADDVDAPVVRRMGFTKQPKPKTQSVSARRKYSRREANAKVDEEAFKNFNHVMDISEYTTERCEELERIYWKTLTYAPPLYGADLMGTLFHESTELWNLNKLPNLLDVLGTKVPGVNTAYLYLGMWKATFAWHLEDVDLYSINYLHFGAPKQWYSISQKDARRFEAAMRNIWPTDAKSCDQFLRHKGFLISPSHLLQHYNIRVNKVLSYPGEFVVTYPYGYHSGYNLGYNCAEAVNFALDSWLPMGKIAKKCACAQAQDSVWVDVYEIERKLRGESTEYEETEDEDDEIEEEDDDGDPSGMRTPPSGTVQSKAKSRKRKRAANDKDGKPRVKKLRLRLKTRSTIEPPCCLCPNDIPGAEVLTTDDGRKAHRICALYLPETYIEGDSGSEVVTNASSISKARLELKCLYCRSRKGACFQCSQKKCARSYHATCAAAAGVFIEEAEVPVIGEDGTEYKEQAFEFSCRFHRTKRDKKLDGEALEGDDRVNGTAASLVKDDICQIQYYRGDIFAGVVVENNHSEQTLLLDIIPRGDRVEVEWKWLLLPDPSDYHLPRASANALPMPSTRKAKDQLNVRRAVDETPRQHDTFAEGYTWAEFQNTDKCKNPMPLHVNIFGEHQLWHFVPKGSTDTKAQYTEDPRKQIHNPKSVFLETMPRVKPKASEHHPRRASMVSTHSAKTHHHPPPPVTGKKAEKPYVYKPRKPIGGSTQRMPAVAPEMSYNPANMAAPLVFNSDPRFAASAPNAFSPSPFECKPGVALPPLSSLLSVPPIPPFSRTNTGVGHMLPHPGAEPLPGTLPRFYPTQGPGVPQPSPPSIVQRFEFFQVHHNRDSTKYRTPYAPWGGFTNGYENGIKTHMTGNPDTMLRQRRPSVGQSYPDGRAVPAAAIPPRLSIPAYAFGNPASDPNARLSRSLYRTPQSHFQSHHNSRSLSPPPYSPISHCSPAQSDNDHPHPVEAAPPNFHPAIRPQYTPPSYSAGIVGTTPVRSRVSSPPSHRSHVRHTSSALASISAAASTMPMNNVPGANGTWQPRPLNDHHHQYRSSPTHRAIKPDAYVALPGAQDAESMALVERMMANLRRSRGMMRDPPPPS